MNTKDENQPAQRLEEVLSDEKLIRLRRAYHELEAFQLSAEHGAAKRRLKERLSQSDSDSFKPI